MSFQGRENVYTCDTCGGFTVTVDVDEGVTPFMLACRASGNEGDCPGAAHSAMYPPKPWADHIPAEPGWEWYRPTDAEFSRLSRGMRDHVKQGGLLLRKRAHLAGAPA